MLFELKEKFVLTLATKEEVVNKLKENDIPLDAINTKIVHKRMSVVYYLAHLKETCESEAALNIVVLLNKDGEPVSANKHYTHDHVWGPADDAAYQKIADGDLSDLRYLTAGFLDGIGHSSLWMHSSKVEVDPSEVNYVDLFIELKNIQNMIPIKAAEAAEIAAIGSAASLIKDALKDVDVPVTPVVPEREEEEEPEFIRVRSTKTKKPAATMSFMHKATNYTMFDYMSVIRRECKDFEWKYLEKFLGYDADTCRVLGDLQNRFHFCEILFEDNAGFTAAYAEVNTKTPNMDAVEIKKYAAADQVGARLPQAYDKRGLFLAVNHTSRDGELKPYVNLYDSSRKMYFTSSPTQNVPYAYALSRATECFTAFALSRDGTCKDLVPKTQSLRHSYTDTDFAIMADVTVTSRKQRKGSISVIFNSQGGRVHGDMGKEQICEIGPIARIMGEGIPAPYKLQAAYQFDARFRSYWEDCVRKAVMARQKDGVGDFGKWIKYVEIFHKTIVMDKGVLTFIEPDTDDVIAEADFYHTLNEAHESNRDIISTFSVDRSNFLTLYERLNAYPNEFLAITMANDLFFDGFDLELVDAGDLVNVGHCLYAKGARMPTHDGENVTFDDKWWKKFDINPFGRKALIDMRLVHKREVFIGGGSYIDKITRNYKETRASVYYDFEPVRVVETDGKREYYVEANEDTLQFKHAIDICHRHMSGEYEQVGFIVSLRSLPYFLKTYSVIFMYPAPFPAVMSVYIIVNKNKKKGITILNAFSLLTLMYSKVVYIFDIITHGFADLVKVLDYQIDLEQNDIFIDIYAAWYQKMVKRFRADGDKKTGIVIDDKMDKMLIVDKAYQTKTSIKRGKQRADYNYGQFGLHARKRD